MTKSMMQLHKERQRPFFSTGGICDSITLEYLKEYDFSLDLEDFFFEANKHINFFQYTDTIQGVAFEPVTLSSKSEKYLDKVELSNDLILLVRFNFDIGKDLDQKLKKEEIFKQILIGFIDLIKGMTPIKGFDHIGFAAALDEFLSEFPLVIAA